MFGNGKVFLLKIFLLVMLSWAGRALAEDTPSPMSGVDAGRASASAPVIPGPMPAGSHSSAIVEPVATEGAQIPGVLREIGQRQTELTILELDLKRAELQKKLRELEAAAPPQMPQFLPAAAVQNPSVPMAPAESGSEMPTGPLVRRIHKIGDELVALILFPGGETKNVRPGGVVGNGVRIVEILLDAVYVRKGEQQRYALPISQSRRGGS